MSPVKIAIAGRFASVVAAGLDVPHELVPLPAEGDAEIARLLADADVLVSARYKAAWRSPTGSGPRLVLTTGAGIDALEVGALPPGCKVCNVFGHERGITEQAVALMLALQKSVFAFDAALRRGNWTPELPYVREMRGHNLLVLGFGHIGRELARWGRFMEMNVTALTRSPAKARAEARNPTAIGGLDELGSFLPKADFVVVAIPATPQTTGLIREKELRLMKPTAFIVNVGRAVVIDETALYDALRERRIAGAGLDVWYQYPAKPGQECMPSRLPFHELDNVIMAPHKNTVETMEHRWLEIARNIGRFARGEPLTNRVGP